MKGVKKIIIPIVFGLVGTSVTTYSFLDTFIITKEYHGVYNANNGASAFSFSFADRNSSSSKPAPSSSGHSSNPSSSSSQIEEEEVTYYENLTEEEINALFTEQVVFEAKKHYSDPDIYVDIATKRFEDYATYYVADIRLKNASFLKAALAKDKAGENFTEKTSEMCIRNKGIIAINGDTYGSQKSGYVIRNGQIIRRKKNTSRKKAEDLAVYWDGRFEIFDENDYTIDEIAEKGAWQVFSFGPGLVNKQKVIVKEGEEVGTALSQGRNQRCAIGMISPLHYLFVVSDGRTQESPGLSLYQIATLLQEEHCYCAYNLDGGGSATMYFDDGSGNENGNGALINVCTQAWNFGSQLPPKPETNDERGVSDCVYIGKG